MDFNFRNQQQQMSSGLTRYHSAPSSLLADFINGVGEGFDDFLPPSSPESESVLARFISGANGNSASPDIREIDDKQIVGERSTQFMAAEQETKVVPQQSSFSSDSAMIYQREQLQNCSPVTGAVIGSTSRVVNSIAIDSSQVKSSSNSSNLIRHSSSPAGFFSHLTVENGYAVMSEIGNFTVGNGSKGETASTSRLRNPTNFISRKARFPETLSQLSHMRTENMAVSIPEEGSLGNADSGVTHYIPGHPISSWNDSPLGNDLTGLKRLRDNNGKMTSGLSPSDVLNGELGDRASGLKHQFSFPKTSLEIDAMEKFFEFQDSIPCKIRAKRGCATHPRSIAERVRRTRISERIRKLEELVPNMDKQTNTADMLDLAVEYIKELQKQVKGLTDNQASCTCSSKAKARPESCMIKEQTDQKEVKASLILDPDNNRTGIA